MASPVPAPADAYGAFECAPDEEQCESELLALGGALVVFAAAEAAVVVAIGTLNPALVVAAIVALDGAAILVGAAAFAYDECSRQLQF
jgi:hypothetical protein